MKKENLLKTYLSTEVERKAVSLCQMLQLYLDILFYFGQENAVFIMGKSCLKSDVRKSVPTTSCLDRYRNHVCYIAF